MTIKVPSLDDLGYADIVEDSIKRIPIYSKEWTNHNVHDPGITILEMLAWIAEARIFELDQITERHRLKFLKLMGVLPRPQQCAVVDLAFTLPANKKFGLIKAGTELWTTDEIGEKIPFCTDRDLSVTRARIEKIISLHNIGMEDNTTANSTDGIFYYSFGTEVRKGNSIYIGFDSNPFPIGVDTLNVTIKTYDSNLPPIATHGDESASVKVSVEVEWQYLNPQKDNQGTGNQDSWENFEAPRDKNEGIILTLQQSGVIVLNKPKEWNPGKQFDNEDRWWIRCTVKEEGYEIPPQLDSISINMVSATQRTILNKGLELIREKNDLVFDVNKSTGLPGQRFFFCENIPDKGDYLHQKLVLDSKIQIDNDEWKEIADFDSTGLSDKVYVLDCKNGAIIFGNGIKGKIPPPGTKVIATSHTISESKSTGLPGQIFFFCENIPDKGDCLRQKQVLDSKIQIDNEEWKEVTDFDSVGSDDKVYALDRENGAITFGDGIKGKIPPVDMEITVTSYNISESKSTGLPGQIFFFCEKISDKDERLCQKQVLDSKIQIDNEEWKEVTDFDSVGPDDMVYVLDHKNGVITFGNGIKGKIPPTGKKIIATSYIIGGGSRGNVKVLSQWSFRDNLKYTVENPDSAKNGVDGETYIQALERLKEDMKVPYTAVTANDFVSIATHTPGLRFGRAKAFLSKEVKTKDKVESCDETNSIVKVIVLPYSPLDTPKPSKGFLDTVKAHIESHRLITTKVYVEGPAYVGIVVRATVFLKQGYLQEGKRNEIEKGLKKFLHPLSGGEKGEGWPFGRTVYLSEIYEVIKHVEGISCVSSVTLYSTGGTTDDDGNVKIKENELVYLLNLILNITDQGSLCTGR